jgi:MFS family permease
MSSDLKLPPRAWLIVALLWVVGCLNYLDRVILTTMRGSVVAAIPMTEAQFGLLLSVFLWIYGLFSPLGGFLADRFNRSRVILASLLVWSLVTFLTAFASTFTELLLTRALMGLSEACYIPAALALITDYHRGPTRSLATGLHMSGLTIGASLGGLGGWISEHHGWQQAFLMFGGFGVIYGLILLFFLRDRTPEPASASGHSVSAEPTQLTLLATLRGVVTLPAFLLALCHWALLGLAGWGIIGWMPTYLQEHFHLPQGEAGLYASISVQISMLIGMLVGGWWADRWSRVNARARVSVVVIGMLLAGPGVMLAAQAHTLPLAICGLALFGLTKAFADANMMPILCTIVDHRMRATAYGILNFGSCLIGGLAPWLGGWLRDTHVDVNRLFMTAAILLWGCAALLHQVKSTGGETR